MVIKCNEVNEIIQSLQAENGKLREIINGVEQKGLADGLLEIVNKSESLQAELDKAREALNLAKPVSD